MEKKVEKAEKAEKVEKAHRTCGTSKQLPDPTAVSDAELNESFASLSAGHAAAPSFAPVAFSANGAGACYTHIDLWTSYGKVKVPVYSFGANSDLVSLQNNVIGLDGKPILIKCVDASANNVNANSRIGSLISTPSTLIKKSVNEQCGKRAAEMKASGASNKDISPFLSVLGSIDVHWLTNEYLEFLHTKLKCNNINANGFLVSMHSVKDLENAYFTGDYMVYGDGGKMFVDMGKADVIAHELGHGLVKSTANMEYRGHSGALNEHMADVLGTCFEFWLYKKYNENESKEDDISGGADWLIGEDVCRDMKCLRSMSEPRDAAFPQPAEYKGQYWSDPNNIALDYGGVHINSGVPNKCFYLAAQKMGIFKALDTWYRTLKKLTPRSSFMDFRDALTASAEKEHVDIITESLNTVGLTREAKSDWTNV
jgi:major membrane immunogen (membrane-anchored lipoprotein)